MKCLGRFRPWFWGTLLAALVLASHWIRPGQEPVYQGWTLTEWLYSGNLDIVPIPNDFYGHIHNELWETVLAGGYAARDMETNRAAIWPLNLPPDTSTLIVQRIGTNAIPHLLQLLSAKPGFVEKVLDKINAHLNARWPSILVSSPSVRTAGRNHIAGLKGFQALGTNAEAGLPGLKRLLMGPQADFELGRIIQEIGLSGKMILVNALTNSNDNAGNVAAFCLGEDPGTKDMVVPLLLSLVEQDHATYQVMGALGRLGGDPELTIPVLMKFLERMDPRQSSLEAAIAILDLGLFGEKARPAIPALVRFYGSTDATTRQVIRMVIKRIQPEQAAQLLGREPGPKDDEDPWWNGTQP